MVMGVIVFVLLGCGIYYIGSLLMSVEGRMTAQDPNPANIGAVLQAVDEAKAQTDAAQQRQEEIIDQIGY
jgi:hypothetical protein